jgi:DNA polymerase III delta prime subunit
MITLGTDSITGNPYRFDPMRHICLVGATGVGKTSAAEHIFCEFVRQGNGGLAMDIHGDFANRLALILPSSIMRRDFIWYNPTEDSVPPFNPLYFTDPTALEAAKEMCVSLLKALSGSDEASRSSAMGNETPHRFRSALDAVTEQVKDPTLVHVVRYVLDDEYRLDIINRSTNPFVKLFNKGFHKLAQKDQATKMAPLINKLSRLMRPSILPTIGTSESLDPLEIMNTRKVMVCRISKGQLGEEPAMILYSLIISMFAISAMRREAQIDRPEFMILADEAQNGVHGGLFGTLLAEARKYAISLVTAFQSASQMPIMDDVLTNAGTQIVFNCSGADADLFAKNWRTSLYGSSSEIIPRDITELSRYEFIARTFDHDQPILRRIRAPKPLKPRRESADRFIKQSIMRWGSNREHVQQKIEQFLLGGSPRPSSSRSKPRVRS